jgi:hypothetical protein
MHLVVDAARGWVLTTDHALFLQPLVGWTEQTGKYIFPLASVNNAENNGAFAIQIRTTATDLKVKVDLSGYFGTGLHKMLF